MAAPLFGDREDCLVGVPPEAPKVILVGFAVELAHGVRRRSARVVNAPLALPTLKISVR